MMPDELDVKDDREEAHEEGGDDEVNIKFPQVSDTWHDRSLLGLFLYPSTRREVPQKTGKKN